MLKPAINIAVSGILLTGILGFGGENAKSQGSAAASDEVLYETGNESHDEQQYLKALQAFQTLINVFADSDLADSYYFAIGDLLYTEGEAENLLSAEGPYKHFIIFYPKHPNTTDAQMKIIAAHMKMMRSQERDRQYVHRALQEIKEFLRRFPDSDYAQIVSRFKTEIEENLAKGDREVGRFYEDRGDYANAIGRCLGILKNNREYSRSDEVYFRMGEICEELAQRIAKAGGSQAAEYCESAEDEAA